MRAVARHWLFLLPLGIFLAYYSLQNLAGFHILPDRAVGLFLLILIGATGSYVLAYKFFPTGWVRRIAPFHSNSPWIERMAWAGLAGYGLVLLLASVTADDIALFAAFAGATADDLGEYRETFLRTRTGVWQVLNYAYVIANNSVMPIVVTYAFWKNKRWRFVALGLFVLGLSLTLQKGAIASAGVPLLALFLIERRFRAATLTIVMMIAVVALMYFLASGRLGVVGDTLERIIPNQASISEVDNIHRGGDSELTERVEPQVRNASAVPDEYNLLGRDDQISLALNRMAWIPYVTAIDWLRFQEEQLGGAFVLGRSIKPLAFLMGVPALQLEREVSTMQWGQNATGTASSNAVYFVDAWVNFGIVGVIAYSALLSLTVKLIVASRFTPLIASASVPVYTACFVSLPAVFLSGGLVIFLVLALLVREGGPEDAVPQG